MSRTPSRRRSLSSPADTRLPGPPAFPGGARRGLAVLAACGSFSFNTTLSGAPLAQGLGAHSPWATPSAPESLSPSCTLHVRQYPPPTSTPHAREQIQGERPALQPGPVQTRCALLPRLLHRHAKGGALLLQHRLRP